MALPTTTALVDEQPARGESLLKDEAALKRQGEQEASSSSPADAAASAGMPLCDRSIRGVLLLVLINAAALIWVVSIQILALLRVCIDAFTTPAAKQSDAHHSKRTLAREPAPPAEIAKSPRAHQKPSEGSKHTSAPSAAAATKPAAARPLRVAAADAAAAQDTPPPRRPASAPGRPPLVACSLAADPTALPLVLRRKQLPPRPTQHQHHQQHQHPLTLQRAASADPTAPVGLSLLRAPSTPIFKPPVSEDELPPAAPAAPVKTVPLRRSVSAGLPQAAGRPPLLPHTAALCAPQPLRRRHSSQAPGLPHPHGSADQKQATGAGAGAAARASADELFSGVVSYRTCCRCATCRFAAEFCSRSQGRVTTPAAAAGAAATAPRAAAGALPQPVTIAASAGKLASAATAGPSVAPTAAAHVCAAPPLLLAPPARHR